MILLELLQTLPLGAVLVWILTCSVLTFAVFGWDKQRAVAGQWRVPEANLLTLAFCGGSVGGKLGQRFFRHKTRKQPFAWLLNGTLAFNLCVLIAVFIV